MLTPFVRLISASAAALCLAGGALAQSGGQGVNPAEIAQAQSQLQTVVSDLRIRIAKAEAENARLNGRIETLEFLLSESREEINAAQTDDRELAKLVRRLEGEIDGLKTRIGELESRPTYVLSDDAVIDGSEDDFDGLSEGSGDEGFSSAPARATNPRRSDRSAAAAPPSDLPGDPDALFADGKSKLLRFDYASAERSFRAFLDAYPDDAKAGEARYWLGEVLYQQENYAESGAAYTTMLQQHPDDPRAPDALVKLARSLRLVEETERACTALTALAQRYPDASDVTRNLAAVERVRSGCSA